MKIFSCNQIRDIDAYTISHEPVASIDLMERAAGKLYVWISEKFSHSDSFVIFTGPGNNGGDGLALARMLTGGGYKTTVYFVRYSDKTSNDWQINSDRLEKAGVRLHFINKTDEMPLISSDDIIIDGIFGSGLTRPADGLAREVIEEINLSDAVKISIDIPSGLFCEDNSGNDESGIIRADYTLTFQFPRLAFMFPESVRFTGVWKILPIGLHETATGITETPYYYLLNEEAVLLLKNRSKFDHKGIYGHGLLVAGSYGKMGAAILGARAALRTGIGLLTCHIPECGYEILQTSVPEAMVSTDASHKFISEIVDGSFTAIGIGPGLGTHSDTQAALLKLLSESTVPVVIDADALNILSLDKEYLNLIPPGSILTPHPREFERLAGKTNGSFDRLQKQREFSEKHLCTLVLKGANTSISTPGGKVIFNSTGNPGMATGGSGDVLTGILLSLLSQGYSPENAAVLGVYLHGLAGDIAAGESSFEAIIASDIIKCTGRAFNRVRGF